ncbi:putative Late nodulin [Medicago truncatula]|uniref:Nodule Cysteine-Rich (NCR) secreted peptide n=1 Tax=Medicago truncatula TaxID=3880 RepID=G7KA04_MEDTR|nr:Nodule Cysteine-Rich (NCR) secreted peptide [Medicago truncatula]RHN56045.1 putative Late nodulin [Medicago truncatula]
MGEIIKFVYSRIIFLSLFLLATDTQALIECYTYFDCPKDMCIFPSIVVCVRNQCDCVEMF